MSFWSGVSSSIESNKKPTDYDSNNNYIDQFQRKVDSSSFKWGNKTLDAVITSDFQAQVAEQELVATRIAEKLKSTKR